MFEVKDGSRTFQFEGYLLSESTSKYSGSTRWIEFALYKTKNGSYILSRIGVSLIYHGAACPLVKRYGLSEMSSNKLEKYASPCEECNPTRTLPVIFPEKYRYWAQVSEDPRSVLTALYKKDKNGAKYLTHVAQDLLEDACENDERLDSIYRVEMIP